MGWLIRTHGLDRGETPDGYLRSQFNCTNASGTWTVLDSAFVGTTWYAAIHRIRPAIIKEDGTTIDAAQNYVFAAVVLTSRRGGEFGYKDMDESMGPNECDCPERIMRLLTPLDQMPDRSGSYAADWRARVAARRIEKAKQRVTKATMLPGTIIKTAEPLSYGGKQAQMFKLLPSLKGDRKQTWAALDCGNMLVRVRPEHVATATRVEA